MAEKATALSGATPSEPTVSYAYDLASHLIGVSDNSASITAPATSASYSANLAYDQLNRALTVNWSPAPAQAMPSAASGSFSFGYDQTNRRINQTASDNSWWSYPTAATNVSYTANALNQYTAVGSVTPSYDGNGNLAGDGTFTYCYDNESRLVSILTAGTCSSPTTTLASYAYDTQGRRKSKTVGSTTTIYVTDADNREVLEYNGTSGAIGNWYSYALGPNEALNQMNVASGTRATFIPDIQGSIVGALDASAGTLTKYGYQAYGESGSTSGSFRYTGQRIDPETNGLYYYRARHYMPAWGRFMQPDPIRYAGGSHLYRYVQNDPLNSVDPTGSTQDVPSQQNQISSYSPSPTQMPAQQTPNNNSYTNLNSIVTSASLIVVASESPLSANYNRNFILVGNNTGPVSPGGIATSPAPPDNPLDPTGLNIAPPTLQEQQNIANTLNIILSGQGSILNPHSYENDPSRSTSGAILPPSPSGYTVFDVPTGGGTRGETRLIINNGTGAMFYTNTHYESFYPVDLVPGGGP